MFERVLLQRLVPFFDKFDIIPSFQHGFRKGYSTSSATVELWSEVYPKIDEGLRVAGILLNLACAFDMVSFHCLRAKLMTAGIRGLSLDLIMSFLKGQT